MRRGLLACLVLTLCGCAKDPGVFHVSVRDATPYLSGPRTGAEIPFSELLGRQYNLNFGDGYVDLAAGMRLRIQYARKPDRYYRVARAGKRLRLLGAGTKPSARWRFFYAVKFPKAPGQPYHPAFVLWGNTDARLAREDPENFCHGERSGCLAFPGTVSASPEIPIEVQGKARYVVLSSTVQDLLRGDRVPTDSANLKIARRARHGAAPVVWNEGGDVLRLPLVAGDRISW